MNRIFNLCLRNAFSTFSFLLCCILLASCRGDEIVIPSDREYVDVTTVANPRLAGLYLLNEGNMGSNKCSLDYLDLTTGEYSRNIYAERNPGAILELGDVGNDIAVYGSRLYAVVNCSHKVEVMDAASGVSMGKIDIPNCRYICFDRGKAYVSSYVGPVGVNADSPKGAVYEVDTASLKITRTVTVGYQPEQLTVVGKNLYVANSGGYRAPNYDNTVSVIDLDNFKQTEQFAVAPNLHLLKSDKYGRLWVASRGNYGDRPAQLFMLERNGSNGKLKIVKSFDVGCSNFAIHNNLLYFISSSRSGVNMDTKYGVIDIDSLTVVSENFITDGTDSNITMPYGIAVNTDTGEILVTDARNYVSSGWLYCFSPYGKLQWKIRTGDIPCAIAFFRLYQ